MGLLEFFLPSLPKSRVRGQVESHAGDALRNKVSIGSLLLKGKWKGFITSYFKGFKGRLQTWRGRCSKLCWEMYR
jgi:hypothetical protein